MIPVWRRREIRDYSLLALVAIFSIYACVDSTAYADTPPVLEVVKPRTAPMHKRVVFVVDVSESMDGQIGQALAAVRMIAEQPTDDMEVAVYSFSRAAIRWPAVGFRSLPDPSFVSDYEAWLKTNRHFTSPGSTVAENGLRFAGREPGPRSLALVSDGKFYEDGDTPQALRKAATGDTLLLLVGSTPERFLPKLNAITGETGGFYKLAK